VENYVFVIGLTGGIGTGKTLVSNILEELGAAIVNADLLGHEVYKPDTEGWQEVVESFGDGVLTPDREVDRRKLGAIVFSDPDAMSRLNAITHPKIYRMVEERVKELDDQGIKVAVVEAALLIEAGWTPVANEIWVTTSFEEKVIERLKSRNNLDEDAIRARIRSQMTQDERVTYADVVIDNNESLEELGKQIQQLWNNRVLTR